MIDFKYRQSVRANFSITGEIELFVNGNIPSDFLYDEKEEKQKMLELIDKELKENGIEAFQINIAVKSKMIDLKEQMMNNDY